MGSYSYTVWIAAQPERVYDLYTDLDRVAEWQEGRPRITDRSGEQGVAGSTYTTRRGPSSARSRVIVAERPTEQVVEINGALGLRAVLTSRFEPEDRGTRMTVELDARWGKPRLGRALEKAVFNPRTARRELAKLKEIAERDTGQPGSAPSER
jgi:uncharacterized protein YndB with AHSA1/START domain